MKPFYATALAFVTVCTLWVASDAPFMTRHSSTPSANLPANYYNVDFGSIGTARR